MPHDRLTWYTVVAHWIGEVQVMDPDTAAPVELSVYKHENGGIFAVDSSYLTGGDPITLDPADDDSDVLLLDPFAGGSGRGMHLQVVRLVEDRG